MRSRIAAGAAFACALVVLLGGCGGSGANKDELKEAEHKAAERAQQHYKIHQVERQLRELRREGKGGSTKVENPAPEGSPAAPSSPATPTSGNCGGGLSANQYTTCGFAENVEEAYFSEIGSGSGTVSAYSSTTGQSYSMYCTAGAPHECTGGNNAAVFFP